MIKSTFAHKNYITLKLYFVDTVEEVTCNYYFKKEKVQGKILTSKVCHIFAHILIK